MTLTIMDSAIQIIDENKIFKIEELKSFFNKSAALADSISPVVAVFGSQSSGKSTLLNYLFDTKFDVMNGDSRTQTTQGIWLAIEPNYNTLVLDVEGSDGRERGEDKDFERKAALFSLAVADVLIINIWENSIGLYNASNINLLKTVLEVFFEIHASLATAKTTILFVVRDYVGVTPVIALENVLSEEITKVWNSIDKPQNLESCLFSDVFCLKFAFLPHKIFKTNEFLSAIDNLREKFFSKGGDAIIDRVSSKRILLQDFPIYSSSIWNVVDSSKSLDLPTQQELLAEHRCEETIVEISDNFKIELLEINSFLENDDLEPAIKALTFSVQEGFKVFNEKLHRYPAHVVQSKNETLMLRLKELIIPIFNIFCEKVVQNSIKIFEFDVNSSKNLPLTAELVNDSIERATTFYRTSLQQLSNLKIDLSFESKLSYFENELNQIARKKIESFFKKISGSISKNFKSSTRSLFADCFTNCSKKFWDDLEHKFITEIASALNEFDASCDSFSNNEILASAKYELENELVSIYREFLLSESNKSTMILRFTNNMEKTFRFDSNGRPRHWESLGMIDEVYDKALSVTDMFVEVVSVYHPSETFLTAFPEFEKEIVIISEKLKGELKDIIKREAEMMFVDAKRSLVYGSNSIPAWVIILLIILGWNEFVAIISSPLYLFVTLLLLSSLFIIHHLNLGGPLMVVVQTVIGYLSTPIGPGNVSEAKAKNE